MKSPVVSCELGKLYNKEAIVEYLLDKTLYGDGQKICGHIRSLKDVKELKLTPNPSFKINSDDVVSESMLKTSPFICPLTLKEMNGKQPFLYIRQSGYVVSEAGLKNIGSVNKCPETGLEFNKDTDLITLNPNPDLEFSMKEKLYEKRLKDDQVKKSKKRKNINGSSTDSNKVQKSEQPPIVSDVVAGARKAVGEALKNTSNQKNQSEAVKSIFGPKDLPKSGRKTDSEWMTQGTWNRCASYIISK